MELVIAFFLIRIFNITTERLVLFPIFIHIILKK